MLVDPEILPDLELDLMADDFRMWDVSTVTTFRDPGRLAFQIRRSLIEWSQGRWAQAADWTVVWIAFGDSWRDGDEPLPWRAHAALWDKLARYAPQVRYNVGLGGVPHLTLPSEPRRV